MLRVICVGAMAMTAACATAPETATKASTAAPGKSVVGIETPPVGADAAWVIALHGGAGVRSRENMPPDLRADYEAALTQALKAGGAVLAAGGEGPAAVEAALMVLEDSPLFNAGHGGAIDERGEVRTDAAIMDGATRDAGAFGGARTIRNPIAAARAIMERSDHVMLDGPAAEEFARAGGLTLVDPAYFITERRLQLLRDAQKKNEVTSALQDEARFGTVGAVVRDKRGNIAAGTSTGGRTNKGYGRIGDAPIIGAGTYASNDSCAVSATGHGEYFMRWTVARDVCARMEFGDETLADASKAVIIDNLGNVGGDGAVIALDPQGNVVFAMNGNGMYRGVYSAGGRPMTGIYVDEPVK